MTAAKELQDSVGSTAGGLQALVEPGQGFFISAIMGVSFRSSDQYDSDIVIEEAEWQKKFRLSAGITAEGNYTSSSFTETPVYQSVNSNGVNTGDRTMVYPGYKIWTGKDPTSNSAVSNDSTGFARYDDVTYTNVSGALIPKPRGETQEALDKAYPDELNTVHIGPFSGQYPVNT